jgi:toxin ParE1/3/4
MTELFLTERAEFALIDIEDYSIETWGDRVADEYLEKIQDAFTLIKSSPGLLRAREEFSDGLLFYRVERHWLICNIIDETVYVLAVWHAAMDILDRLAKYEPSLLQEAESLHGQILNDKGL